MSETIDKNRTKSDNAKSKVKGWIDKTRFVESVIVNEYPTFLIFDISTGKFSGERRMSTPTGPIRPLNKNEMGYIPYEFTLEEYEKLNEFEISSKELLDEIYEQVGNYLAVPERDRILVTGGLLLTYSQEWISTTHYPYFVGEYGSGKTTAILLEGILGYRSLITGSMTYAGIYNSLGSDEEGAGTIAEDEAQNMGKDKISLYTDSYAKGKTVPRVRGNNYTHVTYFKAFCCKWFAGTGTPNDAGLLERLVVVHMLGGKPKKNIKDVYSNKDLMNSFKKLRNKMLLWKLKNIEKGFPKIESGLSGRDRELWNDFFAIFTDTKFEEQARKTMQYYLIQRHDAIKDRVEPKILAIIKPMIEENLKIEFFKMWNAVTHSDELSGTLDPSMKTFYPDFGEKITMNSLSKILIEKFHAKKERDEKKKPRITYYVFDMEVISILHEKYNVNYP